MRILVTGSSGCIGAWTVKNLADRGLDVLCFDQTTDLSRLELISGQASSPQVRAVSGSIEDTALVKGLIRDEQITHVVHLAAVLMPFCQANPVKGALINVIGTLNIFEGARDAGRDVRICYASSSAVWGPEDAYGDRPLTEADSPLPGTHYGVYKHANEGNARVFYKAGGIPSIGLRPWTVYGVGRDHGLTADPTLAMRAAALGQPFQIRVSGFMDLQYVEDVAETFVRCALTDVEGAHVFNLAGSIVEMGDLIARIEAARPEARGLLSVTGPQVPVSWKMDATGLNELIPGLPATGLDEGIEKTLAGFERLRAEGKIA